MVFFINTILLEAYTGMEHGEKKATNGDGNELESNEMGFGHHQLAPPSLSDKWSKI